MSKRCKRCYNYYEPKSNACDLKLASVNCAPGNKDLWFSRQLPTGLDPVLSNIYNGCWLCNLEPAQTVNSILCNRNFYDGYIKPPFEMVQNINTETKLRNIHIKNNPRYNIANC